MKVNACRISSVSSVTCSHSLTCGISILVYAFIGMPVITELFVDYLVRKPPFVLADGDFVHCIPIQNIVGKLPTVTTSWRMAPTMQPRDRTSSEFSTFHSIRLATQLMVAQKQTCPIGAVPRRSRKGMLYFKRMLGSKAYPKVSSVVHLLIAASHYPMQEPPPSRSAALWPNDYDNHKYAIADVVGHFRGTHGRLNIWHPHVQDKEFSLAQVWVSSIDVNGKLHTLEAGWQVYRELYSDSKPRLFIYWTTDDYNTTGCYNLDCVGFIQVSNKWLLGGSFEEVSTLESRFQYEIKIQIFKDRGSGDWWLQLNNDNVGYWPKSLFGPGAFNDSNTRINWGGEIWHRRGHYTDTQMGNGNHPTTSEYRRVAYVRNLKMVNHQDYLQDPPGHGAHALTSVSTYRKCCHLMVHESAKNNRSYRSTWGTYAYFGGPGFNPGCVQERSHSRYSV